MSKFSQFELSGGGSLPTIAFGTGTTFFDRGGEVADVVVKGIRSGYRVRTIVTILRGKMNCIVQ